jgi:hypothetical protein
MKRQSIFATGLIFVIAAMTSRAAAQRLKLSENGRYLQYKGGRPFLYPGDETSASTRMFVSTTCISLPAFHSPI